MSKEIQIMPLNDIVAMAKIFADSGMFSDAKQMSQAFVKIQAGQEIGVPAFQSMSGIHIIQGKTTLGAGVIASAVKGSGKYDYDIKEFDEKICSIDFVQGTKKLGNSTFTIEDARKAGTKNLDKFPKNMLFARAISNGVKWFCPDVFSGPVYVPEEMPEQTHDIQHVEVIEPQEVKELPAKKIPTLSQAHFEKTMASDAATIEKCLTAIEEGKLIVNQGQHVELAEQFEKLLNQEPNE